MLKNKLLQRNGTIIRVLKEKDDKALIINCTQREMPKWISQSDLAAYTDCSEEELMFAINVNVYDIDSLDPYSKKFAHEHYTLIAGILPFIGDDEQRNYVVSKIASDNDVSKQTIRNYLRLYLVFQNIAALAPKQQNKNKPLTKDERNIRWALNKFYYTRNKNSLTTAYKMMLKEKYCDSSGVLSFSYPSIHQFKYFYRKHMNLQTQYISRDGIKSYQRNNRPLLGDGIQEFASSVGTAMLDATICDIYLVNESGGLVGRPILTACIDAYSGLCCGYSLLWEGGVYSLRGLMLNVISDKVEHCKKHGITIQSEDWNCNEIPATLITDMGNEYVSENFEQIAELGITLVNLPSYRPELKGNVEKFFDLIQLYYKPYLKRKGVIEADFQERGSRDYRKDACLTIEQFERIILHCIIYYNTKRIIENYPYTTDMVSVNIKPYASCIWNYGIKQDGANLISVRSDILILTLLPRTIGKFSRYGLKVNKLRYKHDGYIEMYLKGGSATVAYNPDDVSCVWVIENGKYIRFELIESRFNGKDLIEVKTIQDSQKQIVKGEIEDNLQAQIELARHIQTIACIQENNNNANIKTIRHNKQKEQIRTHRDYMKEGAMNV